ncbi:MerR family transcriptional regulator [Clostridium sp. CTA-7]
MILNNKILLTTGEFAKLCNVSKDTLFHYDKLKILSPLKKGDNGYRYYSTDQIESFYVISILKELDVSLKDIKNYINNKTPYNLIDLLKLQLNEVENKIKYLNGIKKAITYKIEKIEKSSSINNSDIFIKEFDSEYLVVNSKMQFIDTAKLSKEITNLFDYCKSNGIQTSYEVGSMTSVSEIDKQLTQQYFQLFVKAFNKSVNSKLIKKQAGRYLITYHKGGYESASHYYKKIYDYAIKNSLKLIDPFYEIAFIDELCTDSSSQLLFEISIRIE